MAPPMTELLCGLLLAAVLLVTPAASALDTSAGVGLQDRALFQETVDYTLTNQSGGDFRGQNLANTSFAGAVGRGADFRDANLHGAILTQGAFAEADFRNADLSDALMDRADFVGTGPAQRQLERGDRLRQQLSEALIEGADFSGCAARSRRSAQAVPGCRGCQPVHGRGHTGQPGLLSGSDAFQPTAQFCLD